MRIKIKPPSTSPSATNNSNSQEEKKDDIVSEENNEKTITPIINNNNNIDESKKGTTTKKQLRMFAKRDDEEESDGSAPFSTPPAAANIPRVDGSIAAAVSRSSNYTPSSSNSPSIEKTETYNSNNLDSGISEEPSKDRVSFQASSSTVNLSTTSTTFTDLTLKHSQVPPSVTGSQISLISKVMDRLEKGDKLNESVATNNRRLPEPLDEKKIATYAGIIALCVLTIIILGIAAFMFFAT